MSAPSLSGSVSRFLLWAKARFAPATCELYRHYLGRFVSFVGHDDLQRIDRLTVESFSVKKHPLEVVRRFSRWCLDVAGLVDFEATKGVEVPKSGRRTRTLTPIERARLRRAARRPLRELMLAIEETAARPHEGRGLDWSQLRGVTIRPRVGLERTGAPILFELADYKARKRRRNPFQQRLIPVSPRLFRLLDRIARRRPMASGKIFCTATGRPWTANAMRCAFRRLRGRLQKGGLVDVAGLVPYLFRHTLATELARDGVSAPLLAEFLGHSSLDLLAWYVHPREKDLCDLVAKKRKRRPHGETPPPR